MATSNKMRALNRLPYDFEDGLLINGIDVTGLNKYATPGGAATIGFTPVGDLSSTNVQNAIAELESEKTSKTALAATTGAGTVGVTPVGGVTATNVQTAISQVDTRLKVVEDIFSPGEDYGLLTTAVTSVVDYGALI